MSRRVIIDTDPGLDDAVAILLALADPALDVIGITSVAGNIGIALTTRNAGRLLAAMGCGDVPVAIGAIGPLQGRTIDEAAIHGDDGLGGVKLPEPDHPPKPDAVLWLAETLRAHPAGSIDLLALGPLTNLALLLRQDPDAARRLGRVIAMGGAIDEPGNVGTRSEFNCAADPHAVAEVLAAGLDLTLVPLDVTRKVRANRQDVAELMAGSTVAAQLSGAFVAAYFQTAILKESRPLHDPLVMLLAVAPELFALEPMWLTVERDDPIEAGALSRDPEGQPVLVAMGIDAPSAMARLKAGLGGAAGRP
ncbi:pyrimidine-specific ribonucleoside hydrolase [Devosia enhydra]|uniref:Pyrimidine-specific ribonucleoside hydrolase n=1 Tax=Devosia enhydra TaxID=665118 RepID=A0A1K2I282_9HYPH|nr:nucleoside hydrolase [Devosia enhydra]SFZ86493.1 pyrimidine-specific ribonucleoside hydrolase [Devosia enhydra]